MTLLSGEIVGRSAAKSMRIGTVLGKAIETVLSWRERAELAALDDRTLSDIGLSRVDVDREYRKAFGRL